MFGGERGIIGNLTFKPAAERICGNVDRVPGRWGGLQVFVQKKNQEELFVLMKSCYSKEQLSYFFYTLSLHKEGDLKKLIEDNCLHVKSVAELAQICGYSVSSFKRAFKEIFDEPIYQWILGKKADRLKERLSGGGGKPQRDYL